MQNDQKMKLKNEEFAGLRLYLHAASVQGSAGSSQPASHRREFSWLWSLCGLAGPLWMAAASTLILNTASHTTRLLFNVVVYLNISAALVHAGP